MARPAEPSALRPTEHLGPAQPRALLLAALLPAWELWRPSQRETLSGHLGEELIVLLQWYSPNQYLLMPAMSWGGTRDTKTETDSDPACPHVARRLIELGSLRK